MSLFSGKLFAGALFAGALIGGQAGGVVDQVFGDFEIVMLMPQVAVEVGQPTYTVVVQASVVEVVV